jgi:hypothetical protein
MIRYALAQRASSIIVSTTRVEAKADWCWIMAAVAAQ